MSAGPRTKRPFAGAASDPAQRQITAFFSRASSTTSSSYALSDIPATTLSTTPLNGPLLPAQVQSNLVNVGMRVRKAISEGHKTGSAYSAFSLWSDTDGGHKSSSDLRPVPAVPSGGVPRELTPFCGIHKVGGLAVQPTADPFSYTPNLLGTDSLPSSQESITSTTSITSAMAMQATSSAATNRKRFFVTDEEEEEQKQQEGGSAQRSSSSSTNVAWRNRADWLDGEISPRSLAPVGWGESSRIMAVPRRRAAGVGKSSRGDSDGLLPPGAPTPVDGGGGQENMAVDDFGEASFLEYRIGGSGVDMDVEYGADG